MRFGKHHVFDLHQAGGGSALVFVKFHGDLLDRVLILGNHHMLERVDTAARFFYLCRHQLAGFFNLGEAEHLGQNVRKCFNRHIEVSGGEREPV